MSMIHNMKKNFEKSSNNMISSLSPTVAMFYLCKPNASEEEIIEFATKNKIEIEVVSEYFKVRKGQDKINENILNLKYGLKYVRPQDTMIREYENRVYPISLSNQEQEIIDLIPDNFPKKIHRPEFPLINEEEDLIEEENFGNTTNEMINYPSFYHNNNHPNHNSANSSKQFVYSSIQNFMKSDEDPKQIGAIINLMKKETNTVARLGISKSLNSITSKNALNRFMQLFGPLNLASWIEEYTHKIELNEQVENEVYELLTNILNFCDKLPITLLDLKNSKLGKKINKLGKCVSDRVIRTKCVELVSRWKKIIETLKEQQKEKNEELLKIEKDNKYEKQDLIEKDENNFFKNNPRYDHQETQRGYHEKFQERYARHQNFYSKPNYAFSKSASHNDNFSHINYQQTFLRKTKHDSSSIEEAKDYFQEKNNKKSRYGEINSDKFEEKRDKINNGNFMSPNMNLISNNLQFKYNQFQGQKFHQLNFQSQKKGGILKKKQIRKNLKVRWEPESKIEKVKIFKMTDEAFSPAVSEEEYQKIQMEIIKNPQYVYLQDLRTKEVSMEKENMSRVKEKSIMAKELLNKMVPQISWKGPYVLKEITNNMDCTEGIIFRGSESKEKNEINELCLKKLSATYFKESDIPDKPFIDDNIRSGLFCFTDDSLPKLENIKKAYNPDKPNLNSEILQWIESNYETSPSPDLIKNLMQKIQNKEFTTKDTNKIWDYLNKHSNNNRADVQALSQGNPQIMKIMNYPQQQFPSSFNSLNMNKQFNYNSNVNIEKNMPLTNPNALNNNLSTNGGDRKFMNKLSNQHSNQLGNQNLNNLKGINNPKLKTKPCRNYHGPYGCNRGDHCHFIHDPKYAGMEIQNFNLSNYKTEGNGDTKVLIPNMNLPNNYGVNDKYLLNNESFKNEEKYFGKSIEKNETEKQNMNNLNRAPFSVQNQQIPSFNMNQKFINPNQYIYMNNFIRNPMFVPMKSTNTNFTMNNHQQSNSNQLES